MIKFQTGYELEYVAASGALAYDGRGWWWEWPMRWFGLIIPGLFSIVTKTLTRYRHKGNYCWWKPWECVRLVSGGAVNKFGLTNPGIDWWIWNKAPRIDFEKLAMIVSIHGNKAELMEMAEMLNPFNLAGVEVNVSCPNTGSPLQEAEAVGDSTKAVCYTSRRPVILKVSGAQN